MHLLLSAYFISIFFSFILFFACVFVCIMVTIQHRVQLHQTNDLFNSWIVLLYQLSVLYTYTSFNSFNNKIYAHNNPVDQKFSGTFYAYAKWNHQNKFDVHQRSNQIVTMCLTSSDEPSAFNNNTNFFTLNIEIE